jgi:phosphoserine phosphatase
VRLLWFVSEDVHRAAFVQWLGEVGRSNEKFVTRKPTDLCAEPSCDCIELPVRGVNEDRLYEATEAVKTDCLLIRDERPRLALFDMDSTLIQQEVIDQLAAAFGLGDQVSAITERAMRGELDFIASFTERLELLRGLAETELDSVYAKLTLMPGAGVLTANLAAAGVRLGIVSGGFSYFADRIGARLGMDFVLSNVLQCQHGQVTGEVIPPVIDGSMKLKTLQSEAKTLGISMAETIAVGDGANDIPMLKESGIGVAHHAKPKVRAEANHCLDYQDLSALSYLVKF